MAARRKDSRSASSGRRSATASPPSPAFLAIRRPTTPAPPPAASGSRPTAAPAGSRSSTAAGGGDRRARGRADRPQDRLGRHRRSVGDPRQRRDGRRHLQIDRRRRDVDAHGPRRNRPHRPHHRPPDRIRTSSMSARPAGSPARSRSAASSSTTDGGTDVGARRSSSTRTPAARASRWTRRIRDTLVAGTWQVVMHTWADVQRRTGQRRLHYARRRRQLEDASKDTGCRNRRSAKSTSRSRRTNSKRVYALIQTADQGSRLAVRRWRRELGGRELAARADRARRLLHPPRRVAGQRRRSSRRQQLASGSRPTAANVPQPSGGAATITTSGWTRRTPTASSITHDGGMYITDRSRPQHPARHAADRPDLSRRGRQRRAVQDLRQHAGRRHDARPGRVGTARNGGRARG